MNNKPSPDLFIFTALSCEAQPIIKYYGLIKESQYPSFSVYRNKQIILTISGIGKIAMAGAVAYTLALFPSLSPVIVNICIAGHKTQATGNILLGEKIYDESTGKTFYPQLTGKDLPKTDTIQTFSLPCTNYQENCIHDMEASAFYEIAVKFSSTELIHCIKVISDNEQSPIQNIQPKKVLEWVENEINTIDTLLKQWLKLKSIIPTIEKNEYNEIIHQYHFTVSSQIKLKALLIRWSVLSTKPWLEDNNVDFTHAKKLLHTLKMDIEQLEFLL
jgi:nucleoside phosphorylase